jgi:hypothetical protein
MERTQNKVGAAVDLMSFLKRNSGWNAEPNAPYPTVFTTGSSLQLTFYLNGFDYDAEKGEKGILSFSDCQVWRLGSPNDEGWYRGQCRYSGLAPEWGEFYELTEENALSRPTDWQHPVHSGAGTRHFLFYFRDETFECLAGDWSFARKPAVSSLRPE